MKYPAHDTTQEKKIRSNTIDLSLLKLILNICVLLKLHWERYFFFINTNILNKNVAKLLKKIL